MLISKFHYTLCLCLGRWLSSLSFRNPYAIKCSSLYLFIQFIWFWCPSKHVRFPKKKKTTNPPQSAIVRLPSLLVFDLIRIRIRNHCRPTFVILLSCTIYPRHNVCPCFCLESIYQLFFWYLNMIICVVCTMYGLWIFSAFKQKPTEKKKLKKSI